LEVWILRIIKKLIKFVQCIQEKINETRLRLRTPSNGKSSPDPDKTHSAVE